MKIEIIEHRGIVTRINNDVTVTVEGPHREFRIDLSATVEDWTRRIGALDRIVKHEAKRNAEFYADGEASVDLLWIEYGFVSTTFENGVTASVDSSFVSLYMPVNDDFEDQETHWVAAAPVLRELLAA
ncbi:hypothetical protein [Paracoccus litorisediminis]|uniref:Uncharacterized protein n=1 Tax=Paracoccus litorisediminis TaxID=2006130 RepID=A0A844HMM4_9RHOB|nr:hypothetical protein [Paracoccus litorisediminis]MTH61170.1 hypothetical protein [Paracoccus litorisediminis]